MGWSAWRRPCRQIHFPDSFEKLELARRRLVFEELFYLAAGLALLKSGAVRVLGWH